MSVLPLLFFLVSTKRLFKQKWVTSYLLDFRLACGNVQPVFVTIHSGLDNFQMNYKAVSMEIIQFIAKKY